MVAYSFQKRFAPPILAGTKRQTIRADRKRHARPGEALQLYTGMRTKHCKLIGRAVCERVLPVRILFLNDTSGDLDLSAVLVREGEGFAPLRVAKDFFARRDGFADWRDLRAFWSINHPGVDEFDGVLIEWRDFTTARPLAPAPEETLLGKVSPGFDDALRRAKQLPRHAPGRNAAGR